MPAQAVTARYGARYGAAASASRTPRSAPDSSHREIRTTLPPTHPRGRAAARWQSRPRTPSRAGRPWRRPALVGEPRRHRQDMAIQPPPAASFGIRSWAPKKSSNSARVWVAIAAPSAISRSHAVMASTWDGRRRARQATPRRSRGRRSAPRRPPHRYSGPGRKAACARASSARRCRTSPRP